MLTDQSSATRLKLIKLSGDRSYLNQIAKEWRECVQVPRTNLQSEQVVTLHLDGDGFGPFDLSIPDLAGEAFKLQVSDRRLSLRHDEFIKAASGVVLFVHPDVKKGRQLTDARRLEAVLAAKGSEPAIEAPTALASTAVPNPEAPSVSSPAEIAWTVEMLPTQVQLVELLQFILERRQRKVRVAVVISAWDLAADLGAPTKFLSRQLPLLDQFLAANDDQLEHAVFGVSAQGGDITDEKEKKGLLNLDDAVKRIKVQVGDDSGHDITKPIAWLLGKGGP